MDFTKLDGFKTIYYLVLLIIFVALMVFLIKSAKNSLRRTGGQWKSILDEVVVGFVVLVAFIIVARIDPSVIIQFMQPPIIWGWNLILKGLRFVGIPI